MIQNIGDDLYKRFCLHAHSDKLVTLMV